MKRTIIAALAVAMALFTACGEESPATPMATPEPSVQTSAHAEPENNYRPKADAEGLLELQMPVTLLGGYSAEELEADYTKQLEGASEEERAAALFTRFSANDDGSATYYFSEDQYTRMKWTCYYNGLLQNTQSGGYVKAFIRSTEYEQIDSDGVPWAVKVQVDRAAFEEDETNNSFFATAYIGLHLGQYQIFCGVPGENWAVHVTVCDAESGETITESDFPTRE